MSLTSTGWLVKGLGILIPDPKGYKGLHPFIQKKYGRLPAITWHYSAVRGGEDYNRRHANNNKVSTSWHFWICYSGAIIQCRSILDRCWAQGRKPYTAGERSRWNARTTEGGSTVKNSLGDVVWDGKWRSPVLDGRIVQDPNQWSIGVEIENLGPLGGSEKGWFIIRQVKGSDGKPTRKILKVEVEAVYKDPATGRVWEAFTKEQIEACKQLVETLQPLAQWRHQDLDPGRKQDPGPAFPYSNMVLDAPELYEDHEVLGSTHEVLASSDDRRGSGKP